MFKGYSRSAEKDEWTTGHENKRLTYPMDVFHWAGWKIVIDDQVYTFKVNPSCEQGCTNKNPDFTCSEAVDSVISLVKEDMLNALVPF